MNELIYRFRRIAKHLSAIQQELDGVMNHDCISEFFSDILKQKLRRAADDEDEFVNYVNAVEGIIRQQEEHERTSGEPEETKLLSTKQINEILDT